MGYLLFVILQTQSGVAMHSLEFQTQQLCEAARTAVVELLPAGSISATCLQNAPSATRRQP